MGCLTLESSSKKLNLTCKLNQNWTRPDLYLPWFDNKSCFKSPPSLPPSPTPISTKTPNSLNKAKSSFRYLDIFIWWHVSSSDHIIKIYLLGEWIQALNANIKINFHSFKTQKQKQNSKMKLPRQSILCSVSMTKF